MNTLINQLLEYAKRCNLITEEDCIFCANNLIDLFQMDEFKEEKVKALPLIEILPAMLDQLVKEGKLEDTVTARDLMDNRIMSILTPRPSEVIEKFNSYSDIKEATDYFYQLAINSNYIRMDRVAKNRHYQVPSPYGKIEISINLSKPEKDPEEIKRARTIQTPSYPTCLLCRENVGFAGNLSKDSRKTLRTIPLELAGERYYLQYSPYVYYNEHAIVFNEEHTPMKIDCHQINKLLDFVDQIPHYFIGSNADLPIVGGSILSHDHFQGGNYSFPMDKASSFYTKEYQDYTIRLLNWPLSTIQITSKNRDSLLTTTQKILSSWKEYQNPQLNIFNQTAGEEHNTITPILRKNGEEYILNLVLRNNKTSEEYPSGIFHPHPEKHHVKKENIGLIEVMGLAILPPRLMSAAQQLTTIYNTNQPLPNELADYRGILNNFSGNEISEDDIYQEFGKIFVAGLEDCGVFKLDEQGKESFIDFVENALCKK